jgi:cytochrome oxidase Cu insertion factor (SCO1/SenC/PrrC family)
MMESMVSSVSKWLEGIPLVHRSFVPLAAFLVIAGCSPAPPKAPRPAPAPVPVVGKFEPDDEAPITIAATPFTLTDQDGEAFDSAALAGKVWMGAIFFANCPGPCFRENQAVAEILREVRDPDFMVVSLTCDPENDTPEVLRRYADRFEADPARWKFLTGDLAVIKAVGMGTFKLPVELGVHSERGVVFDRTGRLRGGYHLLDPDKVKQLVALIREVLAEPAAPETGPAAAGEASRESAP